VEPPFSESDLAELSEVAEWFVAGREFPADCEAREDDGKVPSEMMRRWESWLVEADQTSDAYGRPWCLPYGGGSREQPAFDMDVLRACRSALAQARKGS
jgi:hypothetical protein